MPLSIKSLLLTAGFVLVASSASATEFSVNNITLTVPDGFTVEAAAVPPLVGHPMMACFDDRGRLFIAEAAGTNGTMDVLEQLKPNFIRMLEDTNADGRFDKSTIFADKLLIPNGALWHDGSLYVAEPPGIWRFTDTDNDGVADVREHIAGKVKSNGMSSTLHGPVLSPAGVLFWCGGQSGYDLDKNGTAPDHRIAPGVFTLRTDGTEHEPFSVGGLANPVEVAFSPEGDVFGTVAILDRPDGARHDALMHWVYGGTYHLNGTDKNPLKRTGDFLPPLSHVGQVAPAGVMTYQGKQWGDEFSGNVFWAQFNTFKVVRTKLERQGATFKSEDEDFLVADSVDVHFTDVLQDADGSLIVIDTGGWFRHGCPTSQIAKPEVKGGIYRIRRTGSKLIADPRGLAIEWKTIKESRLCDLLGDPRPAVAERAISTLANRGDKAVPDLAKTLHNGLAPLQTRRNAVWSLARINSSAATKEIRYVASASSSTVRQSAVHVLGVLRDKQSRIVLSTIGLNDPEASIRRESATALGRIGSVEAVPALLKALGAQNDPFLEHSLIYALIQIGEPKATEAGLSDSNTRVRRGALIALNQMAGVQLSREQIAPLLSSTDFELRKAAFHIAAKNDAWNSDIAAAVKGWIKQSEVNEEELSFLGEAINSQVKDDSIQEIISETLLNHATPEPVLLTLLETMRRPQPKVFPKAWIPAVEKHLKEGTMELRLAALAVVQDRGLKQFDKLLTQLAKTETRPKLRIAFISTLGPRLSPVDDEFFGLLLANVQAESNPLIRLDAARTMTTLQLSGEQLTTLANALSQVDPLALPTLLRSFSRTTTDAVGLALISGLDKAPAAANLSSDELARIFSKFSPTVVSAAQSLLKKLGADLEKQQKHIEELLTATQGGDFSRGKSVFFGKKAACSACHRVSGQGGLAGPNLSQIGKIRVERDLLESILYPSASIVQGYHPYTIETEDDFVYSGIITRQTPDAVWIRGTDLVENKVDQKQIKSMTESSLSIMPQGLADALTQEELKDLMAFLRNLK